MYENKRTPLERLIDRKLKKGEVCTVFDLIVAIKELELPEVMEAGDPNMAQTHFELSGNLDQALTLFGGAILSPEDLREFLDSPASTAWDWLGC